MLQIAYGVTVKLFAMEKFVFSAAITVQVSDALGYEEKSEPSLPGVAAWSQANERVLAATTAVIAGITLNEVCRFALRRGWLSDNAVARLEPCESPGGRRVGSAS